MKLRKGDNVKILYGKDAGRKGRVLVAIAKEGKVIVEGMNVFSRHLKGDGRTRESEIVSIVKPLSASKVMLICPSCSKAVRIGTKVEGTKKVRVCKSCGKTLDSVVVSDAVDKKVKEIKTEVVDVDKSGKDTLSAGKGGLRQRIFGGRSQQSYRNAGNK